MVFQRRSVMTTRAHWGWPPLSTPTSRGALEQRHYVLRTGPWAGSKLIHYSQPAVQTTPFGCQVEGFVVGEFYGIVSQSAVPDWRPGGSRRLRGVLVRMQFRSALKEVPLLLSG